MRQSCLAGCLRATMILFDYHLFGRIVLVKTEAALVGHEQHLQVLF